MRPLSAMVLVCVMVLGMGCGLHVQGSLLGAAGGVGVVAASDEVGVSATDANGVRVVGLEGSPSGLLTWAMNAFRKRTAAPAAQTAAAQ